MKYYIKFPVGSKNHIDEAIRYAKSIWAISTSSYQSISSARMLVIEYFSDIELLEYSFTEASEERLKELWYLECKISDNPEEAKHFSYITFYSDWTIWVNEWIIESNIVKDLYNELKEFYQNEHKN